MTDYKTFRPGKTREDKTPVESRRRVAKAQWRASRPSKERTDFHYNQHHKDENK